MSKLTLKEEGGEIVLVTNLKGKGTLVPPAPVITDFGPSMGPPGTMVTIVGYNFVNVTAVRLSGFDLTYFVHSPYMITAHIEDTPSGPIEVATAYGSAFSELIFVVTTFPPF